MKKVWTLIAAFCMLAMYGYSQDNLRIKEEGKTLFKKHAFLQLQGGAAYTLGEAKFKDLISPAAALQLGYKFSPAFGMRLGATGWQAKGGWVAPAQVYKFNYVEGNLDLLFDMASLFGGFNPKRVVSPYLFLGGGGAYGFNNDEAANLKLDGYKLEYLWKENKIFWAARCGLGLDFRLSDAVSFLLEGNVNMVPDQFNSKNAQNPDWQFNALAGLKFNLGKTHTVTEPIYYEPEPLVEPQPKPQPKPEPKPEPVQVVEKTFPVLPTVHFVRGSARLDTKKYAGELETIVSVLKEFSDVNVELVGFCDHTGNDAINNPLSIRRAEAVKKYLIKQGIDDNRLSTKGMGADPTMSGEAALTVQARRVEVQK